MSVARVDAWRRPECACDCHRQAVVRTGPLAIDLRARSVTVDGTEVHLTPREWDLLVYLARYTGRGMSLNEIVAGVFGPEYVTGFIRRRANGKRRRDDHGLVRVLVNRLRNRLGPAGALIVGIYGYGYRLERVDP